MVRFLKKRCIFPVLLVFSTVLIFYFKNGSYIIDLLSSLVFATLLLVIVWITSFLLYRDRKKAAIFSFISSGIIFPFQNTVYFIANTSVKLNLSKFAKFWFTHSGQWLYFAFCIFFILAIFILVKKSKKPRDSMILYLNIFCTIFLVYAGASGIIAQNKTRRLSTEFTDYWRSVVDSYLDQSSSESGKENPDIYYIILDSFSRSDTLMRLYDLDNSEFINDLRSYGFFVADSSYANYTQTRTSMASSLNMMYLDEISELYKDKPSFVFPTYHMISSSKVLAQLKLLDYETVSFRSEASFLDFTNWDDYFAPLSVPNNFLQTYMSSTAISVVVDSLRYRWHDSLLDFDFKKIPEAGAQEGSQFIFVHLYSPHPPFVHDQDGTIVKRDFIYSTVDATHLKSLFSDQDFFDYYKNGYKNQVIYLQDRLLDLIENIRDNSTQPFIIILQGDHGSGMNFNHDSLEKSDINERLGILNAVYFYDKEYKNLYPEISPVNTFRVIFSQYFGINLPSLDDRHFYTTYHELLNFIPVDDKLY